MIEPEMAFADLTSDMDCAEVIMALLMCVRVWLIHFVACATSATGRKTAQDQLPAMYMALTVL